MQELKSVSSIQTKIKVIRDMESGIGQQLLQTEEIGS